MTYSGKGRYGGKKLKIINQMIKKNLCILMVMSPKLRIMIKLTPHQMKKIKQNKMH